ncbi:MAG: arginine repressor, partial [Clostridia bacterium]|nr:arginine repressor [Clostridia bacterium]
MNKNKRKEKILDIVSKTEVNTQEELIAILRSQGLEVTQATVSRDIKELGLVKVAGKEKKYRYARPEDTRSDYSIHMDLMRSVVLSCECAQNMVVIKTLAGNGNAIAVIIDNGKTEGIVGTLAGDDTVFAVTKDNESAIKVRDGLRTIFGL